MKLKNYLTEAKPKNERQKLIDFFLENPHPHDKVIHGLADKWGIDPDEVETEIYGILSDFLTGVAFKHGADPDSDFDAKELKMGIEVEKEHSDIIYIKKAISKAHLSEIKDYYTRLNKMEKDAGVED